MKWIHGNYLVPRMIFFYILLIGVVLGITALYVAWLAYENNNDFGSMYVSQDTVKLTQNGKTLTIIKNEWGGWHFSGDPKPQNITTGDDILRDPNEKPE